MKDLHMLKDEDVNVVFHIPSSQFFEVSSELYDKLYNCNELPMATERNDQKLADVLELLENQIPLLPAKVVKKNRLDKLTIIVTQKCNLQCKYCFTDINDTKSSGKVMQLKTYQDSIEYILKRYPDGIDSIEFFGGEPLLEFVTIKRVEENLRTLFLQRQIKMPHLGIITNGTCITSEMVDFFNECKMAVTISIDGSKFINDTIRCSTKIDSVYDKLVENMKIINKNRCFILGAEVTINQEHIKAYQNGEEWLTELSNLGFDFISMGNVEIKNSDCSIEEKDFHLYKKMCTEMYDKLFDMMCTNSHFASVDIIRGLRMLKSDHVQPVSCEGGVNILTILPDGIIEPCHILSADSRYTMGSIYDNDDTQFDKISNLSIMAQHSKPEKCKDCWMRNMCTAWCRGFGELLYKDTRSLSELRCMLADIVLERTILNITKVQKYQERYETFKQNLKRMKQFCGR